jgi:SAM-dependent methyltransferase
VSQDIHGIPCTYTKPSSDGSIPFDAGSFDLISCLGVLHHVPNVTAVVREIFRCLSRTGVTLIREPIISMGDWGQPRRGLTKRERGIPLRLFQGIVTEAGFRIRHESLCGFPAIPRLAAMFGVAAYNNRAMTKIDALASSVLRRNVRYHAKNMVQKIRPTSAYFVLDKQ